MRLPEYNQPGRLVANARAIRFRCACGTLLTVDERFAGKSHDCPSCKASLRVPAASAGVRRFVPPGCREIVEWAITHGQDSAPGDQGTEALALKAKLVQMARADPRVVSYLVSVLENRSAGATASFGGRPERFLMEALAETGHEAALPTLEKQLLRPDKESSDARRRWRAAAIALGRLRDPRAVPLLKQAQAMGRAPEECRQSIEQLAAVGQAAAPSTQAACEELKAARQKAPEAADNPMQQQEPALPAPAPPAGENPGAVQPACPVSAEAMTEEDAPVMGALVPEVPPPPPPAAGTDLEKAVWRYVKVMDALREMRGPDWREPQRISAEVVRDAVKRAEKAPKDWAELPVLWPDLVQAAVASLPPVREDEARRVLLVVAHKAKCMRGVLDATLAALFCCMAEDSEKFMASGSQVDAAGSLLVRNIRVSVLSPNVVHLTLYPPGSRAGHVVVRTGQDEYLIFAH